ncbi:hypothetical protein GWO43_16060 [candidate division KSB1 bacterium]|nr:hypothetical protein [candidate division KSB1 bacterium]NIV68748.1 hypothetical protein [Phycisphaerae bacterium]NIS25466.1 hypothetical protein [candidate division KSB1 bacterium]NIT72358.1 hypothetical protein [candidate division KSB1 bacterium]NIU26143.1 hypothetical protein [candidate division KSB1 bacterium]
MALTFQSSATSTADTITLPSDVQAGDVMVLCQRAQTNFGGPPSDVTPTGWTDVGAAVNVDDGAAIRVSHKYKIAEAGDASSSVTGMDGANGDWKIVFVFRPDNAADSVAPQDLAGEITDGDPASQTANASVGTEPLIVLASFGERGGNQTGISFSPAEDGSVANTDIDFYRKIYNSSAADVTVDLGDGGNDNSLCSFYLEVTESSAITMNVGIPSETDSALAATHSKQVGLGLPSETDSALSVALGRVINLGLPSETDSVFSLTHSKAMSVGIPTETASALATTIEKIYNLGLPSETASALAVSTAKLYSLGLPSETSTALALILEEIVPILLTLDPERLILTLPEERTTLTLDEERTIIKVK